MRRVIINLICFCLLSAISPLKLCKAFEEPNGMPTLEDAGSYSDLSPTYALPPTPEQVLVVYNTNSSESQQIKDYYVSVRGIPAVNVCPISCATTEEIETNGNWNEYINTIATPIENYLSTHYDGYGNLLKYKIRYIVLTKGIPLKIDDLTPEPLYHDLDGNNTGEESRLDVAVDALVCLLFQDVSYFRGKGTSLRYNPYYNVDRYNSLDYRFDNFHFTNQQGHQMSYLVTRLDGNSVTDVQAMIDRAKNADYSGQGWYIIDDHQITIGDLHYNYDKMHLLKDNLEALGLGNKIIFDQGDTYIYADGNTVEVGHDGSRFDGAISRGEPTILWEHLRTTITGIDPTLTILTVLSTNGFSVGDQIEVHYFGNG